MTLFDVMVIGAGPGGSSAAYHLARGGAKVALVDRDEPEIGGPGAEAISALAQDCLAGMHLEAWAGGYRRCRELRFFSPRGSVASWAPAEDGRSLLFIPRSELGPALVSEAETAGVTLFRATVREVAVAETSVSALGDDQLPSAQLLVLAEGSRGKLAASLGLVSQSPDYAALHALFEWDAGDTAEIHYLPDLFPSTAWCMPSAPGLASVVVSTGADGDDRSALRAGLRHLVSVEGFGGALAGSRPVSSPAFGYLRTGLASVVPFRERVLLVGDVAAVAHPLTLEGTGAAMESGRIAAQHALYALEKGRFSAADLSAYAKALRRRFGVEYRSARILRALLRSERVLERIVGRAQRDPSFAAQMGSVFLRTQSTLGTLTPANILRYLMWWRAPRRR